MEKFISDEVTPDLIKDAVFSPSSFIDKIKDKLDNALAEHPEIETKIEEINVYRRNLEKLKELDF